MKYHTPLIAAALFAIAWAFVGHLPTVQMILLLNFAALTLHQFEEYGWPGCSKHSAKLVVVMATSKRLIAYTNLEQRG